MSFAHRYLPSLISAAGRLTLMSTLLTAHAHAHALASPVPGPWPWRATAPGIPLQKRATGGVSPPPYLSPAPFPKGTLISSRADARALTVPQLYLCTDVNFTGTCHYEVYTLDVCHALESPFRYTVSSIGPDEHTLCQVYMYVFKFPRPPGNWLEFLTCVMACTNTLGMYTYSDTKCKEAGSALQQANRVFMFPGVADLGSVGWGDAIGSFKCHNLDA